MWLMTCHKVTLPQISISWWMRICVSNSWWEAEGHWYLLSPFFIVGFGRVMLLICEATVSGIRLLDNKISWFFHLFCSYQFIFYKEDTVVFMVQMEFRVEFFRWFKINFNQVPTRFQCSCRINEMENSFSFENWMELWRDRFSCDSQNWGYFLLGFVSNSWWISLVYSVAMMWFLNATLSMVLVVLSLGVNEIFRWFKINFNQVPTRFQCSCRINEMENSFSFENWMELWRDRFSCDSQNWGYFLLGFVSNSWWISLVYSVAMMWFLNATLSMVLVVLSLGVNEMISSLGLKYISFYRSIYNGLFRSFTTGHVRNWDISDTEYQKFLLERGQVLINKIQYPIIS